MVECVPCVGEPVMEMSLSCLLLAVIPPPAFLTRLCAERRVFRYSDCRMRW